MSENDGIFGEYVDQYIAEFEQALATAAALEAVPWDIDSVVFGKDELNMN